MRIVLIQPALSHRSPDSLRFPIGLGYIASMLLKEGHQVQVADMNCMNGFGELKDMLENKHVDMVGLTGLITQFRQVKELIRHVRGTTGSTVVVGGGLATSVPEMVLEECGADIAVLGEGENTIVHLARTLAEGGDFGFVPGIAFPENGVVRKTQPRGLVKDLDSLPFPAWEVFPMEMYMRQGLMGLPPRMVSIISSRGCPYSCTFCFHGIFGHKFRARRAQSLVREIDELCVRHKIQGFYLEDDTFILNRNRVEEFCRALISKKARFYWTCNGRVNLVDKSLLDLMRKAGCVSIAYGIESGSQRQLDRIKKGTTVEQAKQAIDLTWKSGIIPHGFIMLGIPGETRETVEESVTFCKQAGIMAEFTITTPIPGSALFEEALEEGKVSSPRELVLDWENWFEEVLINMTSLQSEDLLDLKKKSEKAVFMHSLLHCPDHFFRRLAMDFRVNGVASVIKRILRGWRTVVRLIWGRGLSGFKASN